MPNTVGRRCVVGLHASSGLCGCSLRSRVQPHTSLSVLQAGSADIHHLQLGAAGAACMEAGLPLRRGQAGQVERVGGVHGCMRCTQGRLPPAPWTCASCHTPHG